MLISEYFPFKKYYKTFLSIPKNVLASLSVLSFSDITHELKYSITEMTNEIIEAHSYSHTDKMLTKQHISFTFLRN